MSEVEPEADANADWDAIQRRIKELEQEIAVLRSRARPLAPWRRNRMRRAWIILAVLLPIQYLGMVGPISWLDRNGYMPRSGWLSFAVRIVYAPLIWLNENSWPVHHAIQWYADWWT